MAKRRRPVPTAPTDLSERPGSFDYGKWKLPGDPVVEDMENAPPEFYAAVRRWLDARHAWRKAHQDAA